MWLPQRGRSEGLSCPLGAPRLPSGRSLFIHPLPFPWVLTNKPTLFHFPLYLVLPISAPSPDSLPSLSPLGPHYEAIHQSFTRGPQESSNTPPACLDPTIHSPTWRDVPTNSFLQRMPTSQTNELPSRLGVPQRLDASQPRGTLVHGVLGLSSSPYFTSSGPRRVFPLRELKSISQAQLLSTEFKLPFARAVVPAYVSQNPVLCHRSDQPAQLGSPLTKLCQGLLLQSVVHSRADLGRFKKHSVLPM